MDRERFCRYPDTDVRDILIDYELEKAKKLDKAIHDVEDRAIKIDEEPHNRSKMWNNLKIENSKKRKKPCGVSYMGELRNR